MLKYSFKRVLWVFPTLIGVLLLLFSLTYFLPGDPATAILGPRATPELIEEINSRLHLDRSMPVRLGYYLKGIAQGDLGTSVWSGHSVSSLMMEALGHTAILAVTTLAVAAVIGIILGAFGAIRQDTPISGIVTIVSLMGVALPDFVAALLLMLVFCVTIPILPAIGAGEGFWDILVHLILPATALGIGWVGYLARLTQESMVDVLEADYIRTARAFAIPQKSIAYVYALKNAIIPTITVLGLGVGKLLGGAVFVEIIFSRPGLGKLIVDAVYARDFPVLQGGILVATVLFVLANLVADISYGFVNPQIQYD